MKRFTGFLELDAVTNTVNLASLLSLASMAFEPIAATHTSHSPLLSA